MITLIRPVNLRLPVTRRYFLSIPPAKWNSLPPELRYLSSHFASQPDPNPSFFALSPSVFLKNTLNLSFPFLFKLPSESHNFFFRACLSTVSCLLWFPVDYHHVETDSQHLSKIDPTFDSALQLFYRLSTDSERSTKTDWQQSHYLTFTGNSWGVVGGVWQPWRWHRLTERCRFPALARKFFRQG